MLVRDLALPELAEHGDIKYMGGKAVDRRYC